MPSPRRRAPLYAPGDLSSTALEGMTWPQLRDLAESGLISWADVNAATARRVRARNGGIDPYQHLRDELAP